MLTLTPYSACMSPENAHKLMGFYMEVLILGVELQRLFPIGLSHRYYRLRNRDWKLSFPARTLRVVTRTQTHSIALDV